MVSVKPLGENLVTVVTPTPTVSRRAFYFSSGGAAVFAWLHQGPPSTRQTHGIILCSPLGHEQVHAHRTIRHLADRLAEAGLSVLRFDYHGTGDSADLGGCAPGCAAWLANIRDAIDWMTGQCGCIDISLFGLRFGAALAVQAAGVRPLSSLVLWEPVIRGRTLARELKALSLTASQTPRDRPADSDDIEAAGFAFARTTLDDISRMDLLQALPQCRRALILTRDDLPPDSKLLRHFLTLGIDTRQASLPGYADMMAEPHFTKIPHQAIVSTVEWLTAGMHAESVPTPTSHQGISLNAVASMPVQEKIVQICRQPDLFGILSEPTSAAHGPLVVLPNAGATHHVGPGRLYVSLARHLAELGFRSLRLDLAGLGDSIVTDPVAENDTYPASAFRDIDITLKFARQELQADRVVLMGLCSGAYVAFQSAAQLVTGQLAASVLINPLTFYWQPGWTLESSPAARHSIVQYYLGSALQPKKWLKLLAGRTKIGFLGSLGILAQRFDPRHQSNGTDSGQANAAALGHPVTNDLPGDLDRAVQSHRRLACFFAEGDPGFSLLMSSARRKVKQLCRAGKMSLHFIKDADHTFSRHASRQALLEAIAAYLRDIA
jgi:alpha-beta hydrolase superfamily lysophospholipase